MKKIFIATLLSASFLSAACTEADKTSDEAQFTRIVEYDTYSKEAFFNSFFVECLRDDVNFKLARELVYYMEEKEYKDEHSALYDIEDSEDRDRAQLILMKKVIENRSPKTLIEYAKTVDFDYSSFRNLKNSIYMQTLLHNIKDEEISIPIISKKEYIPEIKKIDAMTNSEEQEKARLALMKKIIANRSPKELIQYIKDYQGDGSGIDYSSEYDFKRSFLGECAKYKINPRIADKAWIFIMKKEYKVEFAGLRFEDTLKLRKKAIANRNLKELIEYLAGFGYDYSSENNFDISFMVQCEKYGVDYSIASSALRLITEKEYGSTSNSLSLAKKVTENRNPKEIIKYATEFGYDYSSANSFSCSLRLQCAKYGVDYRTANEAIKFIQKKEYKAEYDRVESIRDWDAQREARLKLTKKITVNRNPKEIIEYIKKQY